MYMYAHIPTVVFRTVPHHFRAFGIAVLEVAKYADPSSPSASFGERRAELYMYIYLYISVSIYFPTYLTIILYYTSTYLCMYICMNQYNDIRICVAY